MLFRSDGHVHLGHCRGQRVGIGQLQREGRAVIVRLRRPTQRLLRGAPFLELLAGDVGIADQIGRASCRERV